MIKPSAANAGFQTEGYLRDRYICYKADAISGAITLIKSILGVNKPETKQFVKSRYSIRKAKRLIIKNKLAVVDGKPSWFYTAFDDRWDHDPLTKYSLGFIESQIDHKARILVTGCGVGITAFHLADCGFQEIVGVDIIPECISIANQIKYDHAYKNTSFHVDDCFRPTIGGGYDVITVMHWIFSAWGGNYGNAQIENAKDPNVREGLLSSFLAVYAPRLNAAGVMVIELVDAVADYRIASDHPMGEMSLGIYPVRHTPEQVKRCAEANGLIVIDKKLSVSHGHQPRTSFILKKV
jgi:SAM-dependent methyltransferase